MSSFWPSASHRDFVSLVCYLLHVLSNPDVARLSCRVGVGIEGCGDIGEGLVGGGSLPQSHGLPEALACLLLPHRASGGIVLGQ